MGHHHKKRRDESQGNENIRESANQNPQPNMDLSSMLGSLNLNNVDLSKIDMSQVQSIMDRMKLPENNGQNMVDSTGSTGNINNQRIALLNSIKPFLPPTRAGAMDNITRILQIASLMGNVKTSGKK